MILILAGGGRESEEVIGLLEQEKIPYLCIFSTLAEAGNYGRGNAVVGKMERRFFQKVFEENNVCGVIDAIFGGDVEPSLEAMAACREANVPYVKYLRIAVSSKPCTQGMVTGSYAVIAELINTHLGNVLFYAAPGTVRAIAKRVLDCSCLYVSVLRGASFDVEQALEYGIPLVNVLEADGVEDTVSSLIERLEARLLVCDGTAGIVDKAEAAEQSNIPLIITHNMGIEYTNTALRLEEIRELVQSWRR